MDGIARSRGTFFAARIGSVGVKVTSNSVLTLKPGVSCQWQGALIGATGIGSSGKGASDKLTGRRFSAGIGRPNGSVLSRSRVQVPLGASR